MEIINEINIWVNSIGISISSIKNKTLFVIRKGAMGDVLWAEPIIRALASKNKKVVFICGYPELFENYPLSNVSFVSVKNKSYKRVFRVLSLLKRSELMIILDDAYEKAPKQHLLYAYQKTAKLERMDVLPILYLSEKEKVQFSNRGVYIVLHIESPSENVKHRKVYGLDWQHIIDYLVSKGVEVFIISQMKTKYHNAINIKTSLRDLIALIGNALFFIGLDSGPANIAVALNIPELVFFGSVNPMFRRIPQKFNGIVMQKYCELSGCYHRIDFNRKTKSCLLIHEIETPKCSIFTNDEVVFQIDILLNNLLGNTETI